jgi:hypothetical protein
MASKPIDLAIVERILFIGGENDPIPVSLINDKRPKFILLGTPQELINETMREII